MPASRSRSSIVFKTVDKGSSFGLQAQHIKSLGIPNSPNSASLVRAATIPIGYDHTLFLSDSSNLFHKRCALASLYFGSSAGTNAVRTSSHPARQDQRSVMAPAPVPVSAYPRLAPPADTLARGPFAVQSRAMANPWPSPIVVKPTPPAQTHAPPMIARNPGGGGGRGGRNKDNNNNNKTKQSNKATTVVRTSEICHPQTSTSTFTSGRTTVASIGTWNNCMPATMTEIS